MNKCNHLILLMILLAGLVACGKPAPEQKLSIERGNSVLLTATVEALDLKTRKVTLKGEQGKVFTVQAGKEVVNLPQVRVGDKVEVEYIESLMVRKADKGEILDENTVIVGTAEPGEKPAGLRITESATSAQIVAIDTVRGAVTLRMPDRSILVIKAQEPENLKKVKVGDTIVITYSEALAVSVKPATR